MKYHERDLLLAADTGAVTVLLSSIGAKTLRCNHLLRLSYDLVSPKFHSELADLRNAKRMYDSPRAGEARAMGIGASAADVALKIGLEVAGGGGGRGVGAGVGVGVGAGVGVGVGSGVGDGAGASQVARATSAEPEPEPEPEPEQIPSPRVGSPDDQLVEAGVRTAAEVRVAS